MPPGTGVHPVNRIAMINAAVHELVHRCGWPTENAVAQVDLYFSGVRDGRMHDEVLVICSDLERVHA